MKPPAPQPFGLSRGWLAHGLKRAAEDARRYPEETRRRVMSDREFAIDPTCRRHNDDDRDLPDTIELGED